MSDSITSCVASVTGQLEGKHRILVVEFSTAQPRKAQKGDALKELKEFLEKWSKSYGIHLSIDGPRDN